MSLRSPAPNLSLLPGPLGRRFPRRVGPTRGIRRRRHADRGRRLRRPLRLLPLRREEGVDFGAHPREVGAQPRLRLRLRSREGVALRRALPRRASRVRSLLLFALVKPALRSRVLGLNRAPRLRRSPHVRVFAAVGGGRSCGDGSASPVWGGDSLSTNRVPKALFQNLWRGRAGGSRARLRGIAAMSPPWRARPPARLTRRRRGWSPGARHGRAA